MTHFYTSKKIPETVFGEGTEELAAFYEVVEEYLPGANELNKALASCWNPDAYSHDWVLPDGFEVKVKVINTINHQVIFDNTEFNVPEKVNMPMDSGRSLGANVTHSLDGMVIREMGRRCDYSTDSLLRVMEALLSPKQGSDHDPMVDKLWKSYKRTGFLSARILDHITVSNIGSIETEVISQLVESLPEKPFKILCIHDCIRFHPNYGNDVRQQYINILAELADSEILSDIASQLKGKPIRVNKYSNDLSRHIRESEYAIS